MAYESVRCKKLALRFGLSSVEREGEFHVDKRITDKKIKESKKPALAAAKKPEKQPFLASSYQDDASEWVVISGANSIPPVAGSDFSSIPHEQSYLKLTSTNVHLLDMLDDNIPRIFTVVDKVETQPCHRRCPRCRQGSIKSYASSGSRKSGVENAGHLDPWAPVNLFCYDSDFLGFGAWDQTNTSANTAKQYHYPTTIGT